MSFAKNEMKIIAANRRTNNEFNELTKDINMPNIQANKLTRQTINNIDTFLKNINGTPLNNERLVFDNNIVGTYQRKFRKENVREIIFDTHNYRRPQFKELLERLLLGLMSCANYTDSWYIEYNIKGEN
jgi:adenylate kinase family enzyme